MAITFEAVVELHPWCHRGPEGAGDAAEWVDEAVVEYVGDGLFMWLEIDSLRTRLGMMKRHTNTPTTPNTSTANLSRVICFSTGSTSIVRIETGHCMQSRLGYIFAAPFSSPIPSRFGLYTFRHSQMRFHRRYPRPAATAAELMTRDPPKSALVTWQASFSINQKRPIRERRLRPGICSLCISC